MKRWTIRARFLLLLVILLLAVFGAITFIIVRQNTHTLRANLIDQSKSFAALATQPIGDAYVLYQDSGTINIGQQVRHFTDLDGNIDKVEIIDNSGAALFSTSNGPNIKLNAMQASSLNTTYLYDSQHKLIGMVQPYVENFGVHRYAVVYGISYKSVDQNIRDIVDFILGVSALILLVSLAVWYILINRLFLRPVAQLSQLALLISKGELNREIKLERKDEIGDLALAVDTMANSLKADITKLKEVDKLKNEFMMITSHNLRTPLTIINSYLDEIKSLQPPKELQAMLETIGVNATRLGGFAEDVLTISTIEAGQNILRREATPIRPILDTMAKEFTALAKQKQLNFEASIETSATVDISKAHFRSALWNLLDNAYKFTADGGQVKLIAKDIGANIEISIEDTGIGISQQELPKLFTKFHRGTDTMQYDYEGTGIGLYIAKLIIEQLGGQITVQSEQGKGSQFKITLPTQHPDPAERQPEQNSQSVQANSDQSERHQGVQPALNANHVDSTGVGGGDAIGQHLVEENHQQDGQQDKGDELKG